MHLNKNLIFIVAYNHEKLIEKTIKRIPLEILEDPANELLVIDDGSKDNTFYVTDEIRSNLSSRARITVMRNPINQGYGGNQKIGYRYAVDHGFQRVILVHGDGQYAPEFLPEFIKAYEQNPEYGAVFGTRMFSVKSAWKGGMPLYKILGNKILTYLQNKILNSGMSEFHSGYRSYSTKLLKSIPFEANSNDFHFDTEIIIQALAAETKILELPIPTHYGDEICNVNGMDYAWNVLRSSIHYRTFKLGFLYDRKFDLGEEKSYPFKASLHSSHSAIINAIPPCSRVLDIGCGKGYIARRLIEKGCVVDGIDMIDPGSAEPSLRRYYKIDLIRNLDGLKEVLAQGEYDYILLADVLEHLVDPERVLDIIRSSHKVRPRPTVVATTANVAFFIVRLMLFFGQFNYGARGILDRTHVRLFTKKSFAHIFEQASYDVLDKKGIPMPFTAFFGAESRFARFCEKMNMLMTKVLPGFFSYQLFITAKPLPTTQQLLSLSEDHSNDLRHSEKVSPVRLL